MRTPALLAGLLLVLLAGHALAETGVLLPPVGSSGPAGAPINAPATGAAVVNAPAAAPRPGASQPAPAAQMAPAVSALAPGIYNGMDIEGPVLRSFRLDHPRPEICATACMQEQACAAYTYVRPGGYSAGDPPMCYLKARVDRATPNQRVLSGVLK